MPKKVYRVRNWQEYNKALKQRGSLTLWINAETVKTWHAEEEDYCGKGRPELYSTLAIETCMTLKVLLNLAFRQCEGFMGNLFLSLGLKLKVPSYTQMCRRQKGIGLKLRHAVRGPIHVVVDATGLKVFGEGEWKVRQHGYSKRRMWRKLHIGIDVESKEVVMEELTDNHIGENKLLEPLLKQYEEELIKVGGDKGYDSYECHELIGRYEAESAILLQRKAKIRKRLRKGEKPLVRDNIVRRLRQIGRKKWKEESGYHQRSLVENTFYRYKTIVGSKLRTRLLENQKVEALIACNILNKFTQLGMPVSVAI